MKQLTILALALIMFSCTEEKEKTTHETEVKLTSGVIVVNLNSNEYAIVALERTVKDSIKMTITDSSGGVITQKKRLVRDTSYKAWWGTQVLDSAKIPLRSRLDVLKDSMFFRFVPIQKEMVIEDYNRNWNKN
jgi:hypothetical protein